LPSNTSEQLPLPIFLKDGLQEVVLQVNSPVPALLLLSDMMVPGWKVEVDGQSAPLLQADLVLRAVAVEAGEHTVSFTYDDPGVRRGLTLSIIGASMVTFMFLVPLFMRRRTSLPEGLPD